MTNLNPEAVKTALVVIISDLDYDLHKSIEVDEETGEDGYPDLVAQFIGLYDDASE